jgi:hypothetical protein
MLASFNPFAMARNDSAPAACSSLIVGATSARPSRSTRPQGRYSLSLGLWGNSDALTVAFTVPHPAQLLAALLNCRQRLPGPI